LAAFKVADRGYVLAHGNVVAEGTTAELKRDVELLEASYLGEATTPDMPAAELL
jgi:branched-chain amino acid transport system ATP-binding protein